MAQPSAKKAKAKNPPSGPSIPLRLPNWLLEKIKTGMEVRGASQQEMIRLASEVGLAALAKVNYDIGEAVARMAMRESHDDESPVVPVKPKEEIHQGSMHIHSKVGPTLHGGGEARALDIH